MYSFQFQLHWIIAIAIARTRLPQAPQDISRPVYVKDISRLVNSEMKAYFYFSDPEFSALSNLIN